MSKRTTWFVAGICTLLLFTIFLHGREQSAAEILAPFSAVSERSTSVAGGDFSVAPAPPDTPELFAAWQHDLRERLRATFAIEQSGPAVEVIRLDEQTRPGGLVREWIEFASFDGTRIPAVIQHAEGAGTGPAIILIPGHTHPPDSGLAQMVADEGSYHHAAATALARAGFTTLVFELRGFGQLGPPASAEHRVVAHNALLDGSFYKRIIVADAQSAFRVLAQRDSVDLNRIGVAGVSLGGEIAVAFAALSPEIQAIYFAGYGGNLGEFTHRDGGSEKQPHGCHLIPGVRRLMRKEDMTLLLAPRPVLGLRGEQERRIDPLYLSVMSRAWSLAGSGDAFAYEIVPNGHHEFFVDDALEFFSRYLK